VIVRRPIGSRPTSAIRLARRPAAGEPTLVTVPSVEHEQLCDLVRCRDDLRGDLMRARHRLGKFLLLSEISYDGPGETWSRRHRAGLASLCFADRPLRLTIADYLHAHDVPLARRDRIEAELEQLAACSPWTETIARPRCLRGIDTLSALGLGAEIGEFARFEHRDSLACYPGIVASERTTGQQRRQGAITKAGSTTPAACSSRPPTTTSTTPAARASPDRAQRRSASGPMSNHPTGLAALDNQTADRATKPRSWGTQPPHMRQTTRREPADARTASPAATTHHPPPPPTHAIKQSRPLTPHPHMRPPRLAVPSTPSPGGFWAVLPSQGRRAMA
jgi:hypothetical protein